MKKIFHHPIIKAFIGIILFLLIFILLGFRITYHPSLDNNWEAISACAAWAAVVVSGLAIWYAIQVPKKIAEEQNKIALFEKRYEFYITFCKCVSFADNLRDIDNNVEARKHFCLMLNENTTICNDEDINNVIAPLQMKTISTIDQGTYLFDIEMNEVLNDFLYNLVEVLSPKISEENFLKYRDKLISSAQEAKDLLTDKIRTELTLTK